jgi:penicillin-binding protein-related factor A (putative recombinase)
MVQHKFEEDNSAGKRGEKLFKEFLEKSGKPCKDVSDDPKYQRDDIDFIVEGKSGNEISFEVKNDSKIAYTGNIFYESISNVDYGTVGCFEKTKADFIVICSESENKFYLIKSDVLRNYVQQNKKSLRYISRVEGSNSAGYLIPKSKVSEHLKVVEYA